MNEHDEQMLSPSQVAQLFGVSAKTVTRWAEVGKLTAIKTLGGHRRYLAAQVRAILAGTTRERDIPEGPRQPCPGHCGTQIQKGSLACRRCWYRLPVRLRRTITAAYARRGADPAAYIVALAAATDWYDTDRDRRAS